MYIKDLLGFSHVICRRPISLFNQHQVTAEPQISLSWALQIARYGGDALDRYVIEHKCNSCVLAGHTELWRWRGSYGAMLTPFERTVQK
jgi:hypothetical protein